MCSFQMDLEMGYSTLTANIQLLLYVPHVGTLSEQLSHISKEVRVLFPKKVQIMEARVLSLK